MPEVAQQCLRQWHLETHLPRRTWGAGWSDALSPKYTSPQGTGSGAEEWKAGLCFLFLLLTCSPERKLSGCMGPRVSPSYLVQASPSKSLLALSSREKHFVLSQLRPRLLGLQPARCLGVPGWEPSCPSKASSVPSTPAPTPHVPRASGFQSRADLWVPPCPARREEGLTEETGHRDLTASEGEADSRGPPGGSVHDPPLERGRGGVPTSGEQLSETLLSTVCFAAYASQ